MNDITDRIGQLSPLKRALLALEEMQIKVGELERGQHEPIAIIGLSCRFPGAKNVQEFWELLKNGVDAISEIPPKRWDVQAFYDPNPEAPGKMYTRWGGFLEDIDLFDPGFFGISPREAANLDPQQRLLLEVTWEALESAGQHASELAGSQTGVFVGISSNDYANLFGSGGKIEQVNPYIGTGTAFSVAAGRISYTLGLQGPSIAIDTACSSSLVAVHLACQSLRNGESNLAVAGGVNAILSPEGTIYFSKLNVMAHDGRCKTFDASADGYVRSEGCGVVVLKRLSDALAQGDQILAVILGTAINQDGRSNGLTAPNPLAQQAVIRSALSSARVNPDQINFVETHGTGTELGDPIEIRSLESVFNSQTIHNQSKHRQNPLYLGAVKANIGHTEAAAGVAGLIKVVLSLKHGLIPPQLHVRQLNPHVNWEELPFKVPTQPVPWAPGQTSTVNQQSDLRNWTPTRLAGLSSFGFSGTNAHAILAEPPDSLALSQAINKATNQEENQTTKLNDLGARAYILPLSAQTPQALSDLTAVYIDYLSQVDLNSEKVQPSFTDIAYTASLRRSHLNHRLAVVAHNHAEALDLLTAYKNGENLPGIIDSNLYRSNQDDQQIQTTTRGASKIVFVFPGQGSQWLGMARMLMVQEPVFQKEMELCDQAIGKFVDWSLIEQLNVDGWGAEGDEKARVITDIDVIQPALFAIQVSLAKLWQSWGIIPDALVGHSMGEIGAATIAGVLSLEEAAQIICLRSRLMRRVSGQGTMAVVGLTQQEATKEISSYRDKISVAVINGPRSTVISGDPDALVQIVTDLDARGIFARRVKVDVASHSPYMDSLQPELVAGLTGLAPHPSQIPLFSTVNNAITDGSDLGNTYWGRNLRESVQFWPVIKQLIETDHDIFIEVSPHPVLLMAIQDGFKELGRAGLTLPSLKKQDSSSDDERAVMLSSYCALYAAGYPLKWRVHWQVLFPKGGHSVDLPAYPWQHERYWLDAPGFGESAGRFVQGKYDLRRISEQAGHPLLGLNLASAEQPGTQYWETDLSVDQFPYLRDHRVLGTIMFPAAAYLELALAVARQNFHDLELFLDDTTFHQALFLPEEGYRTLQVILTDLEPGQARYQIFSRQQMYLDLKKEQSNNEDRPPQQHAALNSWILHASGRCSVRPKTMPVANATGDSNSDLPRSLALIRDKLQIDGEIVESIAGQGYYQELQQAGLEYGPSFQGIQQLWQSEDEVLAMLQPGQQVFANSAQDSYLVHPTLLDAGFQALGAVISQSMQSSLANPDEKAQTWIPVGVDRLALMGSVTQVDTKDHAGINSSEATFWSYAVIHQADTSGNSVKEPALRNTISGNVTIFDDQGNVIVDVVGLHLQRLEAGDLIGKTRNISDWFFQTIWEEQAWQLFRGQEYDENQPLPASKGYWLAFVDDSKVGNAVCQSVEASGVRLITVRPARPHAGPLNPDSYEVDPANLSDFQSLLKSLADNESSACQAILYLWGLPGTESQEISTTDAMEHPITKKFDEFETRIIAGILHLVQALANQAHRRKPHLWVITQAVQSNNLPISTLVQSLADQVTPYDGLFPATLWGLGRTLHHEHADLHCSLVDLGGGNDQELGALVRELRWQSDITWNLARSGKPRLDIPTSAISANKPTLIEDQVALRDGKRFVARLVGFSLTDSGKILNRLYDPQRDENFRLGTNAAGDLNELVLQAAWRTPPAPGEVEIQVSAAGLNFLDVLTALGLRPDLPEGSILFGTECSGKIVAIGENVQGWQVGDEVIAIAPASFGLFTTTLASLVARKPTNLTWEQAAAIPIVFLTASYALEHLARLSSGERILIHAAAGGVGLAAVQLAKLAGAEIYVTAGSPEKRSYLESLGIKAVMDSRSLRFADEIMLQTGKQGVDVLLNSLAGEAIEKGLSVLRPYGRFLEIGKRDIYANHQIGLWPFQKNISYFAIDLARMASERPEYIGDMLTDLVQRFEKGVLQPLPVQLFPISKAEQAFRFMAQSKHIGKIVLTFSEAYQKDDLWIQSGAGYKGQFDPAASYMITGGLGGLGLTLARWMAERQAQHLALVGRSEPSLAAMEVIEELRQTGKDVQVFQADIADENQIRQLLKHLRETMPHLGGVIHAAGLLEDGILMQLDADKFERVFAPKVHGSWNLHRLTLEDRLDFFVMFSSAASTIGSPGQANYAAANAFMDELAEYRRYSGLPALSINWAPWSEVGLAARPDRAGRLSQRGFTSITPDIGLQAFDLLLQWTYVLGSGGLQPISAPAAIGVMPIQIEQWHEFFPSASSWPYLSSTIKQLERQAGVGTADSAPTPSSGILAELFSTDSISQRKSLLLAYIQAQLGQVLGMSGKRIDEQTSLAYLGLDSLMAVELKNRLETNLKLILPVTTLLRGPSLTELTDELLAQISQPVELSITRLHIEPEEDNYIAENYIIQDGQQIPYRDYPLSQGQRALWFQHQIAPGSVYNPVYVVRINASIDLEAIAAACDQLTIRHPALRTSFIYQNEEPLQRVFEDQATFFIHTDATGWSESELNNRLLEEAYHIYDLERGLLVRMLLFSRSDQDHILMLTAHHIVVDLWSLTLIANEFGILYKALTSGTVQNFETVLPLPQVKYSDYVHWQKRLLESPEGQQMWEYWSEQLSGELPILELPTDWPRPPVQTYDGSIQSLSLGGELTSKIRALAERLGVTPFVILLAAFETLLYRYTGQEDIIIGSPTTGRTLPELTDVIGYFASPVALRASFSDNIKFSDFLMKVQEKVLGALTNQDYPFVLLVEKLHPVRDPSRPPLFQVMFVLQRSHLLYQEGLTQLALSREGVQMDLGGLPLSSVVLEERMSPYDLTMQIADSETELTAGIEYNTALFSRATIDRMLSNYRTLLEHILQDPGQPVKQLSLLKQEEIDYLIHGLNQTQRDFGLQEPLKELCIHRLFEKQVEQTPDAIALVFENQFLSFAELNRRANRLAYHLQSVGIGPGLIVGLILERSVEMIVAILAVLKAGGAYLPMDPTNPSDRLAFMMQDARVSVILTQSQLIERLPTLTAHLLYLDKNWESVREGLIQDENPNSPVAANDLAYIIYTSGSTGRSKGVMVQHAGVCNLVLSQVEGFVMDSSSRTLQFASFSFDASVSEIFTSLISGGTLYLARPDVLLSIPDLLKLIRQYAITTITLPPSVLAMLPPEDLKELKTLVSAGENCSPEIAARWAVGRYFLNAYGPTESTIGPTYYQIDGRGQTQDKIFESLKGQNSVPIGRPIANMRIYLLDANQQPVPIGIPGEIYIGGIGVARGYLNRPELTAEKFIADPFRSIQEIREGSTLDNPVFGSLFYGDRLYRTGDLARYLPDGNLEFMGRVDFQVKIRGFRIELEEIESIINQHVLVQQAAVIARGGKGDEKRLIAYLVPEPGASVSINQLRTYLRQFLPEYMVPASFVILDTLPLNTNGKVDRKALPDINGTRPDLEAAYVPPQTELERVIAAIWQEVLNIEKVGLNDNFFDLGGHSLLLFKVHTRLEEALSRSVSMVDLFRYPTVSALADYLNREPQDRPKLKKSIDRADQQKDAMKRQVDRMREIANTRTSKARDAASKRTSQDQKTTSDKKPGDPGKK